MISFSCICRENWFHRCSVASCPGDRIHGPRKGPFSYVIPDQGPLSMRQISGLFPSTEYISRTATESFPSCGYQLFRSMPRSRPGSPFCPGGLPGGLPGEGFSPLSAWLSGEGPDGPFSYAPQSVPGPLRLGFLP